MVTRQTEGFDARDERRGFHAKQSGSSGGAGDFSAGLRQGKGQILKLALLEFANCQDSGCISRRGEQSRRSVRGLEPVELQKAALGEDDGALDGILQFIKDYRSEFLL
jgi:hypothetical protein